MRSVSETRLLLVVVAAACGGDASTAFDGAAAYGHAERLVALGPRPPGSDAAAKTRARVAETLRAYGIAVEEDRFEAATPLGPIPMTNLLATIPGESPASIVLATHYDTKRFTNFVFVGANDGASGVGALLELARVLAIRGRPRVTYRLAFLDGEEALVQWTATDSLYGSRHLVGKWRSDGTLSKVRAFVLLDMIGDRDLGVLREAYSTGWLVDLFAAAAREAGHGPRFFQRSMPIEDDHVPFRDAGVPVIDLIDYAYGPPSPPGAGAWWHTAEDTLDKISAESLGIVGDVVLRALAKIEERIRR